VTKRERDNKEAKRTGVKEEKEKIKARGTEKGGSKKI